MSAKTPSAPSALATAAPPITDPDQAVALKPHPLSAWAKDRVRDPRDLPFVQLLTEISLLLIPMAIGLVVWELSSGSFPWWVGLGYLLVNAFVFIDRYTLMLHNTSHRRLFRKEHEWMNGLVPWVFNPFFGQTAGAYFAHHIGMHHPENNLKDDLSTTMPFQRDSAWHFLQYWGRFMTLGIFELYGYLKKHRRTKLIKTFIIGEVGFYLVVAGLFFVVPSVALWVFVAPLLMIRFLMMCGNWGQHAFVDASAPDDPYLNSITCINSRYNRRTYNDGYHIGHHVKANRHWTEMPEDFVKCRETYAQRDAIVFEGIDFFMVWLFLMLKRYDWLADRFVDLRETKRSKEDLIALMKSRLGPIPSR